MSDDRFANLETMVAFHENTIQELSDTIYRQQVAIDRLEERVEAMSHLLRAAGQAPHPEPEPE